MGTREVTPIFKLGEGKSYSLSWLNNRHENRNRSVDIKSMHTMQRQFNWFHSGVKFIFFFYFMILCRCSSMVGQTGRRQAITLASGCWTNGIVAHEIGKLYYISADWIFPAPCYESDNNSCLYGFGTRSGHPFLSKFTVCLFETKIIFFDRQYCFPSRQQSMP